MDTQELGTTTSTWYQVRTRAQAYLDMAASGVWEAGSFMSLQWKRKLALLVFPIFRTGNTSNSNNRDPNPILLC